MPARPLLLLSIVAATVLASTSALADAPNEPCKGAEEGDDCYTLDGEPGTCILLKGYLDCVEGGTTATTAANSGSSSAETTAAATTTGGGTTTAASTSGSDSGGSESSGGDGGSSGEGGSAGEGGSEGGETDEGCAVRAPSSKVAGRLGAGLIFAAAALATARRWARRRG